MAARKKTTKNHTPRSRGPHGFSVPEAGAMIGLSANSAYEAAKRGEIPVVKMGNLLIVPKRPWLKMLGAEPADNNAA